MTQIRADDREKGDPVHPPVSAKSAVTFALDPRSNKKAIHRLLRFSQIKVNLLPKIICANLRNLQIKNASMDVRIRRALRGFLTGAASFAVLLGQFTRSITLQ
jgi:hypothetical protein